MGGKKATSTSQVSIPPEVLARYNAINARAETAASKPFQAFGSTAADYVAPMNAQQGLGTSTINASGGPASAGIERYLTPYTKNVADTTGAYMRQQQEQAQSGALGTAASSGAFGGDRAGIAAANLQQQNQMAYGKTMADIMNQGYTQALGASQADLNRGLQAGQMQLGAGTMQQQTEQAGKDAMINRFMQEQGLPYQQAQFLANIALGTGAASGSTTTSTQPIGFFGNLATGGKVDGYAEGGGVAGPMSHSKEAIGGVGYVPEPNLPIGQLMVAQPPEKEDNGSGDKIAQILAMISGGGKKDGGAIDDRHGYADGGRGFLATDKDVERMKKNAGLVFSAFTKPDEFYPGPNSRSEAADKYWSLKSNPYDYAISQGEMPNKNLLPPSTGVVPAQQTIPKPPVAAGPKEYFIGSDIYTKSPNGSILDGYGNPVPYDLAQNVRREVDRQDLLAGSGAIAQTDEMVGQFKNSLEERAQRNKDALVGMYGGNFPVSENAKALNAAVIPPAPTTSVSLGGLEGGARAEAQSANLGVPAVQPSADLTMADTTAPLSMGATLGSPAPSTNLSTMGQNGVAGSDRQNPVLVGNVMTPAPKSSGFDIDRLAASVRWQESGSPTGNYGAIGQPVDRGNGNVDYAYGAYQVMGANIPQWTQEVLGKSMSPEEFLRDPQAQDIVAKAKLAQYYQKYGSAEDVASAWFSGRPLNGNNSVDGTSGKSVPSYVSDVMNKYYNGGEGSGVSYDIGRFAAPSGNTGGLAAGQKPYEDRNAIGKFFNKPEGGLDRNAVLSLLSGLGAMASSRSVSPFTAALQGLGAGAGTYKDLLKQQADIGLINEQAGLTQSQSGLTQAQTGLTGAQTERAKVDTQVARFFTVGAGGVPLVALEGGGEATLAEYLSNPNLRASSNPEVEAQVRAAAEQRSTGDKGAMGLPVVSGYIDGEAAKATMNYPEATASSAAIYNGAEANAQAARSARASLLTQADAISQMVSPDANVRTGALANMQMEAIRYANSILSMAGQPTIDGPNDAQIATKMATLASVERASGAGQQSYEALNSILMANPNVALEPEANAKMMGNIMLSQQMSVDYAKFLREYQMDPSNTMRLVNDAPKAFYETYGRKYLAEEQALKTLIYKGSVKPAGAQESPMEFLMNPGYSAFDKNMVAKEFLAANGMNQEMMQALTDQNGQIDIARVFGG
jgi:hypothetical protein